MKRPKLKYKLITEYRAAIRLLRDGKYSLSIPADPYDAIGKLGYDLLDLAQELERKFIETSNLQKISEEVSAGVFIDDVLNRIYDTFRRVIPYNRIGCALLSHDDQFVTAYWQKSDADVALLKGGYTEPIEKSSLQNIFETGEPRILNDLEAYLARRPASVSTKLLVAEGMRSSLTCPLIAHDKHVGFLFFTSREKNAYKNAHQNIFLQLAVQISILIEKSRLYQQLYELNQQLISVQHALEHKSMHDFLTGIYNRGTIEEMLEVKYARAKRHKQPLSVIMMDVDHFKKINDTYGHPVGDAVLKTVAARMKKCLREYDCVGRYGGEEFLIVLADADYDIALKTAERLSQIMSEAAFIIDDKELSVTLSAGVVVIESGADLNFEKIVTAADRELYRAKHNGRNRVEVCRI